MSGAHWRIALQSVACLLSVAAYAQESPPVAFAGVPEVIAAVQSGDFGDGASAMEYLRARILEVQLDSTARNELAETLARTLADAASAPAWKVFVCRQLYVIGGEEQIDELAPMLLSPETAHIARYALEVIPSPEVNDILWEAIAKVDGPTAAGLASSLAARGGAATVIRLSELLAHPHRDVVAAALTGLGKIGGVEAERLLRKSYPALPEELRVEYYEALLACAAFYQEGGNAIESGRIFEELMQPALPLPLRLAAFSGFVRLRGEDASSLIAEALVSGDAPWIREALGHVRTTGGPKSTLLFAQQLGAVPPDIQVMLIQALADRGDSAALQAVGAGANSPEIEVQYATIDALGALGNETSVPLLLAGLMSADEEAARRSRASLIRVADVGVNGALVEAYRRGEGALRAALAPVLAERQTQEAIPDLLLAASNQEGDVRGSAYRALGMLGRGEHLSLLVTLYHEAASEEPRVEAARAITALCRRVPPSDERSVSRAAIYTGAPTSLTRAGAFEIFRVLGDDVLLPLVISACTDSDSIVKDGAIAALSNWPNATPIHEVLALTSASESDAHKRLALDGFIRMLRLPSEQPVEERVAGFKQAINIAAGNPDANRNILAGLAELESTEALDLAEGFLADLAIHNEAAIAAEKIRSNFYTLSASVNSDSAALAADGDIGTNWQSPGPQEAGQWIEIDMSRPASIKGIVLDNSRRPEAFLRGYSVQVYAKGTPPGTPITTGADAEGITEIAFPAAVTGQIVRVTLTESADEPWVISELRVLVD